MTAQTFRTTKIEKFIAKKVQFMEMQQKVIEEGRKKGFPVEILEYNNNAMYNYTFELCKEFGLEMPHVLGVTPKTGGY